MSQVIKPLNNQVNNLQTNKEIKKKKKKNKRFKMKQRNIDLSIAVSMFVVLLIIWWIKPGEFIQNLLLNINGVIIGGLSLGHVSKAISDTAYNRNNRTNPKKNEGHSESDSEHIATR